VRACEGTARTKQNGKRRHAPLMKTEGTVRWPVISARSAWIASPSSIWSSSTIVAST
jgi:hypothetical protein